MEKRIYHCYFVEVACMYDMRTSALLYHFDFWYQKVKREDIQFFYGEYWVRMKLDSIERYFPYLTRDQIRYTLKGMIENDLLKKGMFNPNRYDRTNWYTLTEKSKKLLEAIRNQEKQSASDGK